ncbi:MAG: low molecular weight phosphatase family protein [Herpetosiphonaceae bacterium]|nr:low molecular weight phosphatase family protein [Herpetosiphonaceae bacterium]
MINEQAFVLVVGGADTGRSPLLAALVRRALPAIEVRSAGVLSHEGEPADNEVGLALEQLGLQLGDHHARPLDPDEVRQADLLLAVDRGTARVLQAQADVAGRTVALSELAAMSDVVDPHRMPLGLWLAAARDFQAQLNVALPVVRKRLPTQRSETPDQPLTGVPSPHVIQPTGNTPAVAAAPERAESLTRINRLLETAQLLPEIVDWTRLRTDVGDRLRAIATASQSAADLTPAATLMIEGLLGQTTVMPSAERIAQLRTMLNRLGQPIDGPGLAQLGSEAINWRLS